MFSQFFGQYLLKRNLISPGQLRFVMALEDFAKVKLGVMAIDAGYMNAKQVEEVHLAQSAMDKRFGEIALEKGYLSPGQLESLLALQNTRHLSLSQTLVDEGVMTLETVERILNEYKQDSGLTDAEFKALKNNDMDTLSEALGDMPALGGGNVYAGYLSLFVRNLVRFIDGHVVLERAVMVDEAPCELIVHQGLIGKETIFTGLAGTRDAGATFAARFGKIEHADLPLTADGMGEFMNIQNGLFLSKLSNEWVELELGVPGHHLDGTMRPAGPMYAVPVILPFGRFELYVGLGEPAFG